MPKDPVTDARLSRKAWLQKALAVLSDEGISGVRVERLARDLGVTKGSFYWHFTDREELFQAMLAFWSEQYNDVVTQNPHFADADPREGLLAAMTKVRQEGLDRYELAMRAWADHDPQVGAAIRDVYGQRSRFILTFFERLGFRDEDAEIRVRLVLCYLSWEPSMYVQDNEPRRLSLLRRQVELLTKT